MHIINVNRDIIGINRKIAERNRKFLDERGIRAVNIMGAIGSGKTIMIEELAEKLKDVRMAAIAGDVISDADARRIKKAGIETIGVNTGTECHLDAHLIDHAFGKLNLGGVELLLIENVGNLVCPTDFDLGEHRKIVIVSVTEGDDTVEKHPAIFVYCDLCIINKVDIADAVGADVEKMVADARRINPRLRIIKTSMKTGDGLDELVKWFKELAKG
ncbi:MAG: hydrogenase accessory protein HypB [Candidatus Altiarchaeales archaeon IMC4]|nr:MAG: hydrogenase accessory protein HypB [Candidatus Altiarchaeales archaeon IMC4]